MTHRCQPRNLPDSSASMLCHDRRTFAVASQAQAALGELPVERLVFCEQQGKLVALLAPEVRNAPALLRVVRGRTACLKAVLMNTAAQPPPLSGAADADHALCRRASRGTVGARLQVSPSDLAGVAPDFAAMLAAAPPGDSVTGFVACCRGGAALCAIQSAARQML